MRRYLALPTVVSVLALLVAMSGTAVAVTTLVTSNKQVAAHVIAGAQAPKGDNKNIISGSIGAPDIHSAAVGSTQLAPSAVTGAKLANRSVSWSKMKLPSFASDSAISSTDNNPPAQPLVSAGGLSLSYICEMATPSSWVGLEILAASSATGATYNGTALSSAPVVVDQIWATLSGSPTTNSFTGWRTYLAGSQVIPVYLDLADTNNAGFSGSCHVDGLLIPAN